MAVLKRSKARLLAGSVDVDTGYRQVITIGNYGDIVDLDLRILT